MDQGTTMCFDIDATPPIAPISGGSVAHDDIVLTSADGTQFAAFEALSGGRVGIVILPDVRGLFRFYEELALRFAEHGHDAIAIDYFGRTAGVAKRPDEWDFWPHVQATTIEGIRQDTGAAIERLRSANPNRPVFLVGFCFGGSNTWHLAASDLDLAGVIGFYGHPDRPGFPQDAPSVISELGDVRCPLLALQGGADPGIPPEVNAAFRDAIEAIGVTGEVIEYDGAPHSFFDRKQDEFAAASADAWERATTFIDRHGGPS